GVILKSQAALVAGLVADWDRAARAAARTILDRVGAEASARRRREVLARVAAPADAAAGAAERFDAVLPFGLPAEGGPLVLH
ncbi:hypothetical protein J8J40_33255, partial [Mycobacterium tuberculosis]|nr:hypothetical protein [Mycobacterium tuberculosis]